VQDRALTGVWETAFDIASGKLSASARKIGNDPPVISEVPTQVVTADAEHVFAVVVSDPDSAPDLLTLTGESDNPALLPAASFSFGGTGSVRDVTLLPVAGATGIAHASLTVSDGSSTATAFFMVAVGPRQTTDVILGSPTVREHSPAGTAIGPLTVVPPPPDPPSFELLDSAAGRFRLEGDTLVVNDPFLLDFETDPRPDVVVRLRDASGVPGQVVTLTIEVEDMPEGSFDRWRDAEFSGSELLDPNISGPYANPDRDEFNNLMEYSQGFPPKDAMNDPVPHLGEIDVGGIRFLTLTYRQRPPTFDPDLSVMPEICRDLATWECGPGSFVHVRTMTVAENLEEVTVRSTRPISAALRELVRLRILR
jgi:hypothetical protein